MNEYTRNQTDGAWALVYIGSTEARRRKKCKNWGFGGLGVPQGHRQHNDSTERIRLPIQL